MSWFRSTQYIRDNACRKIWSYPPVPSAATFESMAFIAATCPFITSRYLFIVIDPFSHVMYCATLSRTAHCEDAAMSTTRLASHWSGSTPTAPSNVTIGYFCEWVDRIIDFCLTCTHKALFVYNTWDRIILLMSFCNNNKGWMLFWTSKSTNWNDLLRKEKQIISISRFWSSKQHSTFVIITKGHQ